MSGPAKGWVTAHSRDEPIASQMVDALDQVPDRGGRHATLMRFLAKVGADEVDALLCALAETGNGLRRQLTAEATPCPTF